ncbi:hypothetical protein CWT12_12160 [Actinomyces sp. 432]|uniref:hypothetical protein n=1 Tax=Actinomyces sp. 432 TaxID=2057798 RepID=UPI0013743B95|nr:hypothetical protein [Actinomyces sp. 432]QHO91906.1 hypothetical protein CWT12_12160 [Actinomyces sp. 432]
MTTTQDTARRILRQELEEIAAQGWADLPVWTDEAEIPGPNIPGERAADGATYHVGLWKGTDGTVAVMCRWYRDGVAWWPDDEGEAVDLDTYQAESEDDAADQYGDVSTHYVPVDADTARRAEAAIRAHLAEVEQEEAGDALGRYQGLSTATITITTTSEEADQ